MYTSISGVTVLGLALLGSATPTDHHVLHERREASPEGPWLRKNAVQSDAIVPVRIGLAQSNLDLGPEHLYSVSHHESPSYGKHWTADEVHAFFAPAKETVDAVRDWLVSAGVSANEIVHSDNKGWLAFDIPVSQVNDLFKTSIHEFEHRESGTVRLGCEEYHVPSQLSSHIDYITPGTKLSAIVKKRGTQRPSPRTWPSDLETRDADTSLPADLRHCDKVITPECIRALYNLPIPSTADQDNAPGFFEQNDYYNQGDLDGFFTKFAPQIKNGTGPIKQLIDGAVGPMPISSGNVNGEADGDLEVAFGLVYPTIPILYQVDDPYTARRELSMFNTFLDALDGSYCNYTAYGITGNSWQDPKYPNPAKGGYKGQLQCGVYKPAKVISISYGEAEVDIPTRYNKRQCSEWMKLGMQGHTIFVASGDFGVAGIPGDGGLNGCLLPAGESETGKNGTIFNPDYLSSCPFITSVGGTQIITGNTVNQPEQAVQIPLRGRGLFSSGGGFSNVYPRPSWQQSAVSSWYGKHGTEYPSYVANANVSNIGEGGGLFNRAGRAWPDVSANSARLGFIVKHKMTLGYGVSYAAPIWASTISLINTERSKAGKGPVGYINPFLYAHSSALNDIVGQRNPGCGTQGWEAVQGWDPVTGLGTPKYDDLLKAFMSLP